MRVNKLGAKYRLQWYGKNFATKFEFIGHQTTFAWLVLLSVPFALMHYRHHILRLITSMSWGRGWSFTNGGAIGILIFLGVSIGISVGIDGFTALDTFGMGPLTGFISSYAVTREFAPIIAAIGFAAQVGCRMTAEIGSMRISEEIDALEAQAIEPLPFVVTTRILAGLCVVVPVYLLTLILGYLSCSLLVVFIHKQSSGTYDHYFTEFLSGSDILLSVVKVVVFVSVSIGIHCYMGFYAYGGPEGVGRASGKAVRASLVMIIVLDMIMTLLFWGTNSGIRISG
ncbi:MAG: ABC transporter permease [Mycobacteriaceae bacterium]